MNWKVLKQLNQLFIEGETSIEILEFPLGKRILEMEYVKPSTKKTIAKTNLYDTFYAESLQTKFSSFKALIEKYNLAETNFAEFELGALVRIENDREEILDSEKVSLRIIPLPL